MIENCILFSLDKNLGKKTLILQPTTHHEIPQNISEMIKTSSEKNIHKKENGTDQISDFVQKTHPKAQGDNQPIKSPKKSPQLTLVALIATIWIGFGLEYLFNVQQELSTPFMNYFQITPQSVQTLYSLYSVAGCPTSLIGGYLVNLATPLYTTLICCFGVYLISLGNYIAVIEKNFLLMKVLKLASGFFGETLIIVQYVIVEKWFSGSYLGLASGLVQTTNSLADTASNFLSIEIFEAYRSLSMPFFYTAVFCGMSSVAGLVYGICELKREGLFHQRVKKGTKRRFGEGGEFEVFINETRTIHGGRDHTVSSSNRLISLKRIK